MNARDIKLKKNKVGFKEALRLIVRYSRKRIYEQIKAISFITIYLFLFQVLILRLPVLEGGLIALGLVFTVIGLAIFMEGLMLGIMPLGERVGVKLPQKSKLPTILLFAFILGLLSTFAEPSVNILKTIGGSTVAWKAPLLFMLLNARAQLLVSAVGIGVGFAVVMGLLRVIYGWSLKPFIYSLISILSLLSLYVYLDPNLQYLLGLAWDSGAITTGVVTVPLVIALGIGASQVTGKRIGDYGVFGIITLAGLTPVIAVLIFGIMELPNAPSPMTATEFFMPENRDKISMLFPGEDDLVKKYAVKNYALHNADYPAQLALFNNDPDQMNEFLMEVKSDDELAKKVFGSRYNFYAWALEKGSPQQQAALFQDNKEMQEVIDIYWSERMAANAFDAKAFLKKNLKVAVQAIIPLVVLLMVFLFLVAREKLPQPDLVAVGLLFAFFGMILLKGGLEMGLSSLGNQSGWSLPVVYTEINVPADMEIVTNFDPETIVQSSISQDGEIKEYFNMYRDNEFVSVPFKPEYYHEAHSKYHHIPTRGPLFGKTNNNMKGIFVAILFAFILGYGSTLAEPALVAFGISVEDITVGFLKRTVLIKTVAVGVAIGVVAGVCRIIWNIPLFWMLVPPYLVLLVVTKFSTEDFVNIAWDSAGVTTGIVTVPLILAMGLGIGDQVGVVDGFGLLAVSSIGPILTVLILGLQVNRKRKKVLSDEPDTEELLITGDEAK